MTTPVVRTVCGPARAARPGGSVMPMAAEDEALVGGMVNAGAVVRRGSWWSGRHHATHPPCTLISAR